MGEWDDMLDRGEYAERLLTDRMSAEWLAAQIAAAEARGAAEAGERIAQAQVDAWDRAHDEFCVRRDWSGQCTDILHINPYLASARIAREGNKS